MSLNEVNQASLRDMTNVIVNSRVVESCAEGDHVQFMPFSMKFNGETEVQKRFNTETKENKEKGCLENSFRGYPLEGVKMTLPEKYAGLVLDTGVLTFSGEKENIRGVKMFKEFTYWNYDRVPSENDNLAQALQWTKVAEALHGDTN
eukprot:TRINITY_DN6509_c0_g1_i1.p1 TRINITY_DN6509_c0_g1~~TRINITY_DN6509_c0_g1_i1.p1  ORF type:complete len:147 (+),score=20.90 TRINITY_DN6509_c0_g1_i1:830-1270(+)